MIGGALRLPETWRGWLLIGSVLVAIAVALFVPAMPQPPAYHAFADGRSFRSVPNFLNVMSNLPFLVAGIGGLLLIARGGGGFHDSRERRPYVVFFVGATLTCFGSSWYHLEPDNERLVWDRLPMTFGFAGLVCAALAERVDARKGLLLLWPLMLVGAGTVFWWQFTERRGAGNVIPYGAFQGWSVLVIVLLILAYPAPRESHGRLLVWAAVWYGLAKVLEAGDGAVYVLTGGWVSGHSIKHLLASGAVFAIWRQLWLRGARSAPTLAQPT